MQLYFKQVGENGTPLVILHGVFGSSDNWLTIGKVLSENHRVFMLDQRNHGRSPRSEEFNLEVMAEDLKEFLEEHQLHDAVLIGHSMGGKVAMQFAMNYPTAFDKLIVVDIAPRFYPVHHSQILQGLSAIPLATLASRQEADDILADYESDPAVRQFLLKNLYRNTDLGHFDWRINLPVIQKHIAEVGSELANRKIIHRPTLFIRGSESPYILSEDEKVIHQLFSDVAIVTIQGAGHWVQADRPNEFVASVLQFV
ncbi:MAG: alpha/beta fold hydrolase [Spirosomataceae bacterium]